MIHAVTDGTSLSRTTMDVIAQIHKYIDAVCLREKALTSKQLQSKVEQLLLDGVPRSKLIVHSHPDIAAFCGLYGVHFSEFDSRLASFKRHYPFLKAGRSVHSLAAAQQAEQEGADYLYFGHIFTTPSKKGVPGRGLDALREITGAVSIPVIAIGGLSKQNKQEAMNAGAAGAAMISEFFGKGVTDFENI